MPPINVKTISLEGEEYIARINRATTYDEADAIRCEALDDNAVSTRDFDTILESTKEHCIELLRKQHEEENV